MKFLSAARALLVGCLAITTASGAHRFASDLGPPQGAPPLGAAYHLLRRIPLGDSKGWDYLTFDTTGRRLFIANETEVLVVDAEGGKVSGTIAHTPGVHGITLAPELGRGFTSNGGANSVTIFDLRSLATIAVVNTTGKDPDAITFDPTTKRVFTMNAGSMSATAIEAATGTVAGTVALGGGPEFAVPDGHGAIYVNLETTSELVKFDASTLKILSRWPLAPCKTPSSLAIDTTHHRLFAGCRSRVLAVVDAGTGHVIATLPIGNHVDATVFDATAGNVLSSTGDGTIAVVHQDDADHYRTIETVTTAQGAKTMALDPSTHTAYTVTAERGRHPAPTAKEPNPRGPLVPGTFSLLVLAP